MKCEKCEDVRNFNRSFCKFCSSPLTDENKLVIANLVSQVDSNDSYSSNLIESKIEEERRIQREENAKKKAELAEQKRQIELANKKKMQEAENRINRIKGQMTEVELLNYELQERILEVLLQIAPDSKASQNRAAASTMGILAGIATIMNDD